MKKFQLLLLLSFFISVMTYAQVPQKMNYQAVVRDANGQPLASGTVVAIRFQIHDGSISGPVVYQEAVTTPTNQFGLINLKIGATGDLSLVDWSSGPKYLQVQVDPQGGVNYYDMGTSELLSVPYAMFAGNGGNGGGTGPRGATGSTGSTGAAGAPGVTGPAGLQGSQGNQGPAGVTGAQGPTGPIGPQGAQGLQGLMGPQGTQGVTGPQGVPGVTGPQGTAGTNGAQGPTGAQGIQGIPGTQGATGPQGLQGVAGLQGSTGPQGVTGANGVQGPTGLQGIQGNDGAQGPTGLQGIPGSDGAQGPTGLQGVPGLDGAQGATGADGIQGPIGVTGAQGLPGADGQAGPTGAQGPAGNDGAVGPTGVQGIQGLQGIPGTDGAQGPTGNDGPQGVQGIQGEPGVGVQLLGSVDNEIDLPSTGNTIGDSYIVNANGHLYVWGGSSWSDVGQIVGPQGVQGIQGTTGPQGLPGVDGLVGPQGVTGNDGAMGPSGPQGPTGATGSIGARGDDGVTGATGADGMQGPTGANGTDGAVGATGAQGPTGADGLLTAGEAAGNTPYWDGSQWITNSSNIHNNGGNVGIGTNDPQAKLDVAGNARVNGDLTINDGTQNDGYVFMTDNTDGQGAWKPVPQHMDNVQRFNLGTPYGGRFIYNTDTKMPQMFIEGLTTNEVHISGPTNFNSTGTTLGETFSISVNKFLNEIYVDQVRNLSATAAFTLKLYDGVNGSLLATSSNNVTINGSATNSATFNFASANLELTGGHTYYFELTNDNNTVFSSATTANSYSDGELYVDGAISALRDLNFYVLGHTVNRWENIGLGTAGPQGPVGAVGATGVQGPTGADGVQGPTGADGIQGPTGAQGATGVDGLQGPTGANGNDGAQGPTGADGAQGATGADGAQGPTGADGIQGPTGAQGDPGADGANGSDGSPGIDGAPGADGFLLPGDVAGNTPFWNGTDWVRDNSNIYNNGGNVGVGTTTPSQKLEVEGTIRISNPSSNNDLEFNVAARPSIYPEGDNTPTDLDLQIRSKGAGVLQLNNDFGGNVEIANGGGNVGIGVSPQSKLDVDGQITVRGGSPGAGKVLTSDADGLATWETPTGGAAESATVSFYNDEVQAVSNMDGAIVDWQHPDIANTNGTMGLSYNEGMFTNTSGNVLVVNIAAYLTWDQSANCALATYITKNDSMRYAYSNVNASVYDAASTNITSNMVLQPGDHFGVYVWHNCDELNINAQASFPGSRIMISQIGGGSTGGGNNGLWTDDGSGHISNNGNVGIGTTSNYASSKLTVSGNGIVVWGGTGSLLDASGGFHGYDEDVALTVDGKSGKDILRLRDANGTLHFVVDGEGNVGIGTAAPGAKLDVDGVGIFRGLRVNDTLFTQFGGAPNMIANGDNHDGGGIAISDDGGFHDFQDGFITFNGDAGLRIAGANGNDPDVNTNAGQLAVQGRLAVQGSFTYDDGSSAQDGYVLTRDIDGIAKWQPAAGGGGGFWSDDGDGNIHNNNSGDVGIGTSSNYGSSKVTIAGGGLVVYSNTGSLFDASGDNHGHDEDVALTVDGKSGKDILRLRDYGDISTVVVVDASGNMGIGIATPAAKFDVDGKIKIHGGNPGDGKVLTSDADGLASWQTPATPDFAYLYLTASNGAYTNVPMDYMSPSGTYSKGITVNGDGQLHLTAGKMYEVSAQMHAYNFSENETHGFRFYDVTNSQWLGLEVYWGNPNGGASKVVNYTTQTIVFMIKPDADIDVDFRQFYSTAPNALPAFQGRMTVKEIKQ